MGVITSNKQINLAQIDCSGTLKVTLSLSASPDLSEKPADIFLLLDHSAAMAGGPLTIAKTSAIQLIHILGGAGQPVSGSVLGGGNRMGVISFADTASLDSPLTDSLASLETAVTAVSAGGLSNPADAFAKAVQSFDPASANSKAIVLFSSGKPTGSSAASATAAAAAAKAAGITVYCVGIPGLDGIDEDALNAWATAPAASHTTVIRDIIPSGSYFPDLADNITKAGCSNIVINETVNPDFTILCITPPTKGSASTVSSTQLRWTIPQLGQAGEEGAVLEFCIRHIGTTSGIKPVNQSITYHDQEGNTVHFPDPTVYVDCGTVVDPERCPEPVEFSMDGCSDSAEVDLGAVYTESSGRIAQVTVHLKNICPNRRTALAIMLSETDADGNDHPRGMKTITVPAHHSSSCRDVTIRNIKFILPDHYCDGTEPATPCATRNFKAHLMAHSIDSAFDCHGGSAEYSSPSSGQCRCDN